MRLLLTPIQSSARTLLGNRLVIGRYSAALVALSSLFLFLYALPSRVAWLMAYATHVGTVLEQQTRWDSSLIGVIAGYFPFGAIVIEVGVMLLYCLMALLIYTQRSNEWMGLITAAGLPAFALHITPTLHTWMGSDPTHIAIGSLAKGIGLGLAFIFLYLFPSGYYVPSWMRYFLIAWGAWVVVWLLNPDSLFSFRDPYTISPAGFVLLMFWWATGIFAQIYRFMRVSRPLERQQTKFITFGMTFVLIGYSLYVPLRETMASLPQPDLAQAIFGMTAPYMFLLMVGAVPITITFSILRYRLWDIDLIIRRTLMYSALTALLALIYFGSMILLQAIFLVVSGQESEVAIVISTVGIAALFSPLRARFQDSIDRRFYRSRYDAEHTLAMFSAQVRDEVELDKLVDDLLGVIEETMQPESVCLWLRALEDDARWQKSSL